MITEDFCSYEISRLLKEKGFKEACRAYYDKNGEFNWVWNCGCSRNDEFSKVSSCPTHQMAMKWLREKHNIIITPQPEYFSCDKCESWGIDIWAFDNYEKLPGDFPTYEEAVEAALKYCLTELF